MHGSLRGGDAASEGKQEAGAGLEQKAGDPASPYKKGGGRPLF